MIDPVFLQKLCNYISKHYDIIPVSKLELLSQSDNFVFRVPSLEKKFIFRIVNPESCLYEENSFYFECAWLVFIAHRGSPVSHPILGNHGKYVGKISYKNRKTLCALFTYAEGTTSSIQVSFTVQEAKALGRAMAKIHIDSEGFHTNYSWRTYTHEYLVYEPFQQIMRQRSIIFERTRFFDVVARLSKSIMNLNEQVMHLSGGWGVIGGDFNGLNQHFNSISSVTCFDFELCGIGARIYDLATVLSRGRFRFDRENDSFAWDALIEGYISLRSLSKVEIDAIPVYAKARELWYIGVLARKLDLDKGCNRNFLEKQLALWLPEASSLAFR